MVKSKKSTKSLHPSAYALPWVHSQAWQNSVHTHTLPWVHSKALQNSIEIDYLGCIAKLYRSVGICITLTA